MEEPNKRCGMGKRRKRIKRAVALDLARAFERVSLFVAWVWATHFSFTRKILRVLCGYFEHQRRVQSEGCVAETFRVIRAILPGSKWSSLLWRIVRQDALSEVSKIYSDDIKALLKVKKQGSC